jgi:hypothetical protein
MPRTKGSKNHHHKEKPQKEKKARGRPKGSIKQKQHQTVKVKVVNNFGRGVRQATYARPGGLRVFSLLRLGGPSAAPQTVQQKPSSAPAPARPADLRPHDSCSPRCPTQEKLCRPCPLDSSRQLVPTRCMPQSAG